MADISIPGASSKYGTDKLIEGLMKVKQVPLDRMEKRSSELTEQKKLWQGFNMTLGHLRDSSQALYGSNNAFRSRSVETSNPAVVTGQASRNATPEAISLTVKELATTDKFISRSLPQDFQVDQGLYTFHAGKDDKVEFFFAGGDLKTFVSQINKNTNNPLKASVFRDTAQTQVLVIESTKTGTNHNLSFENKAGELLSSLGELKKVPIEPQNVDISKLRLVSESSEPAQAIKSAPLIFTQGQKASFTLPASVNLEKGNTLEIRLQALNPATTPNSENSPPKIPLTSSEPLPSHLPRLEPNQITGAMIPSVEELPQKLSDARPSLDYFSPPQGDEEKAEGGVASEEPDKSAERSSLPFVVQEAGEAPTKNLNIFSVAYDDGTTLHLPAISDQPGEQTLTFKIPDDKPIRAFSLENESPFSQIQLTQIKVFPPEDKQYEMISQTNQAKDALIVMDGVSISRHDNVIDDLIEGVTLNLGGTSDQSVSLEVKADTNAIKDSIINFIGLYNQLLARLSILTASADRTDVVDELTYLSETEKEQALKELGTFSGDRTLVQLKNSLQNSIMSAYPTEENNQLSLLAQAGISTDAAPGSNSPSLRGYLQLNEAQLDETLARWPKALQQLFGNDTNGDLVVDSGVAFSVGNLVRPYAQQGGIVGGKIVTIDSELARNSTQITNYKKYLADHETTLKKKYGQMEGILDNLQKSSDAINSFSKGQN